jgi:hypothetical protein
MSVTEMVWPFALSPVSSVAADVSRSRLVVADVCAPKLDRLIAY